jgi:hypothetical protein
MGWYAFVALAPRWNARQGREGGAVPDAVMRGETRTRLGYGGTGPHPPDREESAGSTGRYTGNSPFKKGWTFSWIGEGSIPPLGTIVGVAGNTRGVSSPLPRDVSVIVGTDLGDR